MLCYAISYNIISYYIILPYLVLYYTIPASASADAGAPRLGLAVR